MYKNFLISSIILSVVICFIQSDPTQIIDKQSGNRLDIYTETEYAVRNQYSGKYLIWFGAYQFTGTAPGPLDSNDIKYWHRLTNPNSNGYYKMDHAKDSHQVAIARSTSNSRYYWIYNADCGGPNSPNYEPRDGGNIKCEGNSESKTYSGFNWQFISKSSLISTTTTTSPTTTTTTTVVPMSTISPDKIANDLANILLDHFNETLSIEISNMLVNQINKTIGSDLDNLLITKLNTTLMSYADEARQLIDMLKDKLGTHMDKMLTDQITVLDNVLDSIGKNYTTQLNKTIVQIIDHFNQTLIKQIDSVLQIDQVNRTLSKQLDKLLPDEIISKIFSNLTDLLLDKIESKLTNSILDILYTEINRMLNDKISMVIDMDIKPKISQIVQTSVAVNINATLEKQIAWFNNAMLNEINTNLIKQINDAIVNQINDTVWITFGNASANVQNAKLINMLIVVIGAMFLI